VAGKGGRKVNAVQKVCNCKNDTHPNHSRNGEEGIKENGGEDEFKYGIFDTL
jgi:hypothetical protein